MTEEEKVVFESLSEEQKELFQKLNTKANNDALTGLLNRSAFAERLKQISPVGLCIVSCDANNLKTTNDTYGHNAGDTFLRIISNVLQRVFGEENVYRTGGDEFTILLENTGYKKAEEMIDMANKFLSEKDREYEYTISASFGFFVGTGKESIQEIIGKADNAMYINKQAHHKAKKKNPYFEDKEVDRILYMEAKRDYNAKLKQMNKQRKDYIKNTALCIALALAVIIII